MQLVPARCPSCGASIQVDDSIGKCFCQYCGNQLIVEEAIQLLQGKVEIDSQKRIDNYIDRALDFYANNQFDESEKYCNMALDLDFSNERARSLLTQLRNTIRKPNIIISCTNPASSSKYDSIFVNGERQNQSINPYGHLILPVGHWSIYIQAGMFSSNSIEIDINNNMDKYEIKYKKGVLKPVVEVKKIK